MKGGAGGAQTDLALGRTILTVTEVHVDLAHLALESLPRVTFGKSGREESQAEGRIVARQGGHTHTRDNES